MQINKPLKISIIGSRGYPYVYSGYETLVKAIAERMTTRGVEVTVYCHSHLFATKPKQIFLLYPSLNLDLENLQSLHKMITALANSGSKITIFEMA